MMQSLYKNLWMKTKCVLCLRGENIQPQPVCSVSTDWVQNLLSQSMLVLLWVSKSSIEM